MRSAILILILIMFVIFSSCSEDSSTESPTISVFGIVLDKASQLPLSGVTITIGDRETTTITNGAYAMSNLTTGVLHIRAKIDGYASFDVQVYILNVETEIHIELETYSAYCNRVKSVFYKGKTYNTVLISNQCWFRENLNVGTRIDMEVEASNNGTVEKYCYSDLVSNCDVFGGLYKWDEAMNYISGHNDQGICPDGWHIPTDVEFRTLMDFVILDGNTLKDTAEGSWGSGYPCCIGTNTSGFSAKAGGRLMNPAAQGEYFFSDRYEHSFHWSSTESNITDAFNLMMWDGSANPFIMGDSKGWALSVRCLKD